MATEGQELNQRKSSPKEQLGQARRQQRLERYEQARELHRCGWDYRRIGRCLGVQANTVRKFVEADSFPERVAPHRIRNARILYEEVKRQGFQGSYDAVCDCVAPWRAPPDESPKLARCSQQCSADQLSWLAVQRPDRRRSDHEQMVTAVSALGSAWARGIELARQFAAALRREVALDLDEWIAAVIEDAPRELQRFAQGLRRDRQAVANALTSGAARSQASNPKMPL